MVSRAHDDRRKAHLAFLSVLNGYVENLNIGDPTWVDKWEQVAPTYAYHVSDISCRATVPDGFAHREFDLGRASKWDLPSYELPASPFTGHNYSAK
jgi:hypothetical protein